jgi:hypothetical protein
MVNSSKFIAKNVIVKITGINHADGSAIEDVDSYRPEIVGYFKTVDIYPFDRSNMFDLVQATDDKAMQDKLILCYSSVVETSLRGNPEMLERDNYIFTVTLYGDNIDPVVTKIRVFAKGRKAEEITAEIV